MWVPLVENNEFDSEGADYFVRQHIDRLLAADRLIDTIVLGCTHYPLLQQKISRYLSAGDRGHLPGSDRGAESCGLSDPAPGDSETVLHAGTARFLFIGNSGGL